MNIWGVFWIEPRAELAPAAAHPLLAATPEDTKGARSSDWCKLGETQGQGAHAGAGTAASAFPCPVLAFLRSFASLEQQEFGRCFTGVSETCDAQLVLSLCYQREELGQPCLRVVLGAWRSHLGWAFLWVWSVGSFCSLRFFLGNFFCLFGFFVWFVLLLLLFFVFVGFF